ncbi:MAG: TRAP transporter permease [Candidatus Atribacteria bacterium]|nr:TRAP transporter permease [Candidatus Atribacteria bacterium]
MSDKLKNSFLFNPIEENLKFRFLDDGRLALLNLWLIALIGFHFYTVIFGQLPNIQQGAVHLGFVLPAIFWVYSSNNKLKKPNVFLELILHAVPAIASFICNFYIVFNFKEIAARGGIPTTIEYVLGILLFVLIFEAGRRVAGNLAIIALFFLFYTKYGYLFPGFLKNPPISLTRIIQHFYLTAEGIYGIAIYVASTFVVLFVVFGSFIAVGGAAQFFIDLGFALAGKQSGGPAKVAVISSGLLGMINGSSIANVATTGTFTIPLMKKLGYKPEFAAAVEAVASTGGQILPPIMGAAAFIMAQFLGISYAKVMIAATFPALLYYFSLYVNVHLEAKKLGLKGLSSSEIPRTIDILKTKGYFIIPVIVIIGMLAKNYSAVYAAFGGIVSMVVLSFAGKRENYLTPNKIFIAMRDGGKDMLTISMACSLVGFVIGTASITGLGLSLANNIIVLAKGNILLTLIFAMLSCLLLGMALPTTANYVVTSTIIAPALFKLGIPLIVSHLFCFQYGITADITPPVCMATYTGAGIAGANVNKAGILGVKLGIAAFLIPFVFVKYPMLLLIDFKLIDFVILLSKIVISLVAINAAFEKYFLTKVTQMERIILFIGGFLLMFMDNYLALVGLIGIVAIAFQQFKKSKTEL